MTGRISVIENGNWPTIETGQETVATAGTPAELNGGDSLAVPDGAAVVVRSDSGNDGNIYVGDGTVDDSTGFVLGPSESIEMLVRDVSAISIDTDTDGSSVSWLVEAE